MMQNPLSTAAAARPEHLALVTADGQLTYAELAEAARRRAGQFVAAGVCAGQRVGLVGSPSAQWVIDFHGLLYAGAVVAPLSPRFTALEWADAVDVARLDWIHGLDSLPVQTKLRLEISAATAPIPDSTWALDADRLVMLTSGTTDRRRAVSLKTSQLVFSAFGSAIRLGHDPQDRWLACLPLHHMGGISILMRAALYGITVVLDAAFDPRRVNAALDQGEATLISLVPTMLERLLDERADRPFAATVRCLLIGGAALPIPLRRRCAQMAAPVSVTWGMTEAASQVCTRAPGDLDGVGVGAPLPFTRVDVHEGRLRVHGPLVGGVLVTGDAGVVDAEVTILGRADDVIVSGGVNLSPAEIEDVLELHPGVAAALVVGRPDPKWGQRPVAVLVASDSTEPPSSACLDTHCRGHLSAYKCPDAYAWRSEIPRDPLGKRRRGVVRAGLQDGDSYTLIEVVRREESDPNQPFVEQRRAVDRLELGEADAGVLETHDSAQIVGVSLTKNAISEGDGAAAQRRNLHGDVESISLADGSTETGLGVHQRQRKAQLFEDGVGPLESGMEHLLETNVGVLVNPSKEDDSGAVHLVETRSDRILKRHELSGAKGP